MNATGLPSLSGLSAPEALRVEQLCTSFETRWKEATQPRPRLEDFLPGAEWLSAGVLLCELLRLELAYRRQCGEQPMKAEYLPRFPGQEAVVRKIFAIVGLDENQADWETQATVPASETNAAGKTAFGTSTAAIAGYEILGSLGQGSMGTVFKARQLSANRMVALKVIRADRMQNLPNDEERQKWFARFQWEVEAVANLDHPHIVPLYEVGEYEDQPYFSMKLVEGDSLANQPDRFLKDPRAAAQLMALVARAVHHAHQRQILHRDLKPHNILIDKQGQPLVTDFGLAMRIEPISTDSATTDGIAGTPSYMAPEQARADRGLTTAVDVYGLGAVLYHLLTGHAPHRGESTSQTLRDVLEQDPRSPRALNAHTDYDLEVVCLKCLSKEPANRYRSALEVAEELERWIRGEPIHGRRVGPVERLRKWVRRRPGVAAAWACVLVAVLTVGFFAHRDANNRAERLQLAIDRAIAAALGDDLEQSEKAIHEAELQGASTGQVRFLRGLVSLQRIDVKSASDDLEPAVDLLPDSVAVRALLAIFHFRAGRWAKHDQRMKEMASMTASTPEDFLFKGYQESFYDPELALKTLDQAVGRRNTGIARAIRAEARARYALDRSDRAQAEEALKDALFAKESLPANPFVLSASLQAHLVAAILHDENKDPNRRETALKAIELDVETLKDNHYGYPWVGAHCAKFYEMKRNPERASDVLRKAAEKSQNIPAVFDYVADLYRRGDVKRALDVVNDRRKKVDDSEGDRLRVLLLYEFNGPKQADEAIDRWLSDYSDPENLGDAVVVLLFLGRKEDKGDGKHFAQGVAKRIRILSWPSPNRIAYDEKSKDYASGGRTTEKDLLEAANWSRSCRCSAYFLIGMTRLADGNVKGAKDQLEEALRTQDYFNNDYILSRAIKARLKD